MESQRTQLTTVTNPFQDNVVQDAWQAPTDVAAIHDDVFQACLAGIESAAREVQDSLLIYGPSGSGKTHLLTRLQRHLVLTANQAPDQALRCVFVFVRLQTSAQMLWQHVRRRLARDLMRREEGLTQLQRLVAHQIAQRTHSSPRAEVRRLRVLGKEDHDTVEAHLSDLAVTLDLPRDLCVVLEHLLCNRGVRDASAWLAGDSLPERVLAQLYLGPDEEEDREEAARKIVMALARLAGGTLPIVFCFDQVEALQHREDDYEAFFRFGRLAADLHDADPNVFLITCLQSGLSEHFRRAVRQADADRLAKRHAVLSALTPAQVDAIIRARLESTEELREVRRGHPAEEFFPLSADFVGGLAKDVPCVPRRVLARAARAFDEIQHGRATPRPGPREFLDGEWSRRLEGSQSTSAPAQTTSILLKATEVLSSLSDVSVSERDDQGADLVLERKKRVALSIRNEADGRSLGPKLKALAENVKRKDGATWAIVRDPRLTIAKTATKTRDMLAQLVKDGVRLVEPSAEALAALDALSSLLADAKSGDLANDGDTLAQGEVLKWLRNSRDDLRFESITEFVDDLVEGNGEPSSADEHDLGALLAKERVITLEAASRELGREAERLLEVARAHEGRFLILEGPPRVLLDVAGITSEVGA